MLAHLQGISPSAGVPPANFRQKKLAGFFCVSVLLFAWVERLCFSHMQDFLNFLSEMGNSEQEGTSAKTSFLKVKKTVFLGNITTFS